MNLIKKISAFLGLTIAISACETDFSPIGSDMIDNDLIGFEKYTVQQLHAQTQHANDVNTRDFITNSLGHLEDNTFGNHTAHLVAQVGLPKQNPFPTIGENPVIDSVYLYIPFKTDGLTNKNPRVIGNATFDLKVVENGYLLSTSNPNNNFNTQFYFSEQKNIFDQNQGAVKLNNSNNTKQNTSFEFSTESIKLYQYKANGELVKDDNGNPKVKETKEAGLWLDLDKNYFQNKFFSNNKYKTLINQNLFQEYFRGLYFQVNNPSGSALAQFDLSKGNLVFVYKQDNSNNSGRERKEISFSLGKDTSEGSVINNITVALFENQYSGNYLAALSQTNNPLIWLKGVHPSYAKISLFGNDSNNNGKPDELETIIQNKWLINQAVLTLTVDTQTADNTNSYPNRLFLYDFKNNKVIEDYTKDQSTNPIKAIYSGIYNSNTKKYQFRITNYIKSLIEKDSTNYELGLVVADDISNPLFNYRKENKKIPLTASESPLGTVIYGPNHSDTNKKMKLEIYYTKK